MRLSDIDRQHDGEVADSPSDQQESKLRTERLAESSTSRKKPNQPRHGKDRTEVKQPDHQKLESLKLKRMLPRRLIDANHRAAAIKHLHHRVMKFRHR